MNIYDLEAIYKKYGNVQGVRGDANYAPGPGVDIYSDSSLAGAKGERGITEESIAKMITDYKLDIDVICKKTQELYARNHGEELKD